MSNQLPIRFVVVNMTTREKKVMTRDEYVKTTTTAIDRCQKENEESMKRGDRFSRTCSFCYAKNPQIRWAAVECGHIICSKCAADATECHICEISTKFVRIFEESSRECAVCFTAPIHRILMVPCGHTLCWACNEKLSFEAAIHRCSILCPHCRASVGRGRRRVLVEDVEPTSKKSQKETRSREDIERSIQLRLRKGQLRDNQRRLCPVKNFTRPDKGMTRVNQPMKQQKRF